MLFLKIHTQTVLEKLFRLPFLKNQNGAYLWIISFIQFAFIVRQVEDYQNIMKLRYRPIPFTSHKA